MTTLIPNTEFARLASDEDIATVVTALTAKGMAASVVENRAEARCLTCCPEEQKSIQHCHRRLRYSVCARRSVPLLAMSLYVLR